MKQLRNRLIREMTGTVPALRQPGDACGRARAVADVENRRRANGLAGGSSSHSRIRFGVASLRGRLRLACRRGAGKIAAWPGERARRLASRVGRARARLRGDGDGILDRGRCLHWLPLQRRGLFGQQLAGRTQSRTLRAEHSQLAARRGARSPGPVPRRTAPGQVAVTFAGRHRSRPNCELSGAKTQAERQPVDTTVEPCTGANLAVAPRASDIFTVRPFLSARYIAGCTGRRRCPSRRTRAAR